AARTARIGATRVSSTICLMSIGRYRSTVISSEPAIRRRIGAGVCVSIEWHRRFPRARPAMDRVGVVDEQLHKLLLRYAVRFRHLFQERLRFVVYAYGCH